MIELAEFLDEKATEIRRVEAEGQALLHESGDQEGYEWAMHQKAELLSGMYEEACELDGFPDEAPEEIADRLERFSMSADHSMEVGSVFYMSALLYPEDYEDGDPNDLELFAAKVRALGEED